MLINKFALAMVTVSLMLAAPVKGADPKIPGGSASAADLKLVVSAVEDGYRELKDLQAQFSQKTTLAALKRDEQGSGQLLMRLPTGSAAMFRFDYRKPKQEIVSDGRQLWLYIPENRQVMVSDVKTVLSQGGVALNYLTGLGSVSRDFSISFSGKGRDAKGNYLIDLVPKKAGQAFAKLQLTVSSEAVDRYREKGQSPEPFPILSSVVHDQMGNRTVIEYSKVRVNQGIAADRFKFKVPKGVEVIKP